MTNKMEILHVGCDGLSVAFQGCVSKRVLKTLAREKASAEKHGEESYAVINGMPGYVFPNGVKGGFRYIFDQGPLAPKWQIKESQDPNQWNMFARVPAQALAENGVQECIDQMKGDLKRFGAIVLSNSVNRFDICADIIAPGFELDAAKILCHSHSSVSQDGEADDLGGGVKIIGGGRIETVTIGKMPGRQVQIYDKRKKEIRTQKSFWLKLWGFAEWAACPVVWRVEVRAGKKSLDDWNIKTLDDLERKIGDYVSQAFNDIRYLESRDVSNISRAENHSFWDVAKTAIVGFLSSNMCGAKRGKVREVMREDQTQMIERQIIGLAANLGALLIPDNERGKYEDSKSGIDEFFHRLGSYISRKVKFEGNQDPEGYMDKVKTVSSRYHFLNEGNEAYG